MIVVRPFKVLENAASLTSTNIPMPDTEAGEVEWTAGTYSTGTRRIKSSTRLEYEVVASPNTADDPEVGVLADPQTWVVVGYANRWRMFDGVIGTVSSIDEPLVVEIEPDRLTNGVAGFGMNGVSEVTITMTDPVEGVVYQNVIPTIEKSTVVDWFSYFFEPISFARSFIDLELPPYSGAMIKVEFDGPGKIVVGELVMGRNVELGTALYGTGLQLLDFSRREVDAFGNFKIVPRRTSKLTDYKVSIPTSRVAYVFNTISDITNEPCVWVGTDTADSATVTYGYYRDSSINISYPSISMASIQVQGLI